MDLGARIVFVSIIELRQLCAVTSTCISVHLNTSFQSRNCIVVVADADDDYDDDDDDEVYDQ